MKKKNKNTKEQVVKLTQTYTHIFLVLLLYYKIVFLSAL